MKIVHVCLCGSYNDYWGYQDNMIPKYNILDGHEVTVITSTFINSKNSEGYEKVSPRDYYLKTGEKIIRIPFFVNNFLFEKLRIYRGLERKLENENPDIIFIHSMQFVDLYKVINYKKNNPNVKIVIDSHATYDNSAKNFLSKYILHKILWKKIINKYVDYFEKIYMIAPACKKFAIEMYSLPDRKIEYLYLGADTERIDFDKKGLINKTIRTDLGISETDLVFVTGGKLSKGKNISNLMKVFKHLKNPDIKLIIFGKFSQDENEKMLKEVNNDKRIIHIGWIEGESVYDYYLASDVAIFPGTKSALWEQAICSGLPIIARKWEGMEYVDVGGNCLFLENGSVKEIKMAIEKIYSDKKLRESMSKIAMTMGYEIFSYEKISKQAIDV